MKDAEIRLLSYNCCALPVLTRDIEPRLKRLAAEIEALDPDVAVFSELFLPRHQRLLRERLPRLRHFFSGTRAWRTFGGGLAVFSRFPMVDARFLRFRDQGPLLRYSVLARLSRKGCVDAVVHPPEGPPFRLMTAHPAADYRIWQEGPAGRDGRGASSRLEYIWKRGALARGNPYPELQRRQFLELRRRVLDAGRDLPLVLAGDLNLTPRSKLLQDFLARTGLHDSMPGVSEPSVIREPYYSLPFHDAPEKRIDYVLVRPGTSGRFAPSCVRYVFGEPLEVSPGKRTPLSDHLGVLAELRWRESRVAAQRP